MIEGGRNERNIRRMSIDLQGCGLLIIPHTSKSYLCDSICSKKPTHSSCFALSQSRCAFGRKTGVEIERMILEKIRGN